MPDSFHELCISHRCQDKKMFISPRRWTEMGAFRGQHKASRALRTNWPPSREARATNLTTSSRAVIPHNCRDRRFCLVIRECEPHGPRVETEKRPNTFLQSPGPQKMLRGLVRIKCLEMEVQIPALFCASVDYYSSLLSTSTIHFPDSGFYSAIYTPPGSCLTSRSTCSSLYQTPTTTSSAGTCMDPHSLPP